MDLFVSIAETLYMFSRINEMNFYNKMLYKDLNWLSLFTTTTSDIKKNIEVCPSRKCSIIYTDIVCANFQLTCGFMHMLIIHLIFTS